MRPDILFTRRRFLVGAGAAGAALVGGAILEHWTQAAPTSPVSPQALFGQKSGPLVLVTLYGGNDGLNTLIPYGDPAYLKARPNLGYRSDQVLPLADGLGLNPQLKGLASLWHSGKLAVVRGVGYPNPVLSHFESMDIWQSANPIDGTGAGWLGKWLDLGDGDPIRAISVGTTLPPVLRGNKYAATAVTSTELTLPGDQNFQNAYSALQATGSDRVGLAAAIATSGADLLAAKAKLDRLSTAAPKGTVSSTDLSAQMAVVASLIRAGAPTQVYQVSLSSFDTHAAEKPNQEKLLSEFDTAITSFFQTLSDHPAGKGAVVMTYSEFGRRPTENASQGTDHGTAAPMFIMGQGVKGGQFYGEEPSLTSLDPNGNLVHSVDFRSVYATVLEGVLGADSSQVLGGQFPTIAFL